MSVILLTSAVVLSLMCAAYIIYENSNYKKTLKRNVSTLAAVVASNSAGALAFDSPQDATEILSGLAAEKHIIKACLFDKDSNLFARYPSNLSAVEFPFKPGRKGYIFENKQLFGFEPVIQNKKVLGTLYIVTDLKEMYSQLSNYALIGILIIIGSLFVAYMLSQFLQKSISAPILELEQTAKLISANHDYSVRARKSGEDEVGALTDAFNLMLTRIENQNQEIRLFSSKLEQMVTDRTAQLREQKEFVEAIINASVDVIAVFDTEMRFLTINSTCEEFYGLNKEDVIGRSLLEVFPELKNQSAHLDLMKAIEGEFVHNLYYKSLIKDNTFESFLIPMKNLEGDVYSVVMMAHDITEIIEANSKLELINSELLKSNRDLEQFAYVASHDLQEPLRKIQTFSQLLSMNLNDKDKLIQYHEKISQAASRMQQLIKDVLNFSKISNSEEAFEKVSLNSILASLKNDFELVLNEKTANINYDPLPVIKGIPLQLTQLFSNLISNSLKYNDKKPIINISWRNLTAMEVRTHPKLIPNSPYIEICFSDNGIGFDPQFSERIFAIFQRLHSKSTYSGTGIGLALCRKIVENHGGIMFAEGEPGKGATFTIILPNSAE